MNHLRQAWAQRIASKTYFHGTGRLFRPGDVIRPGGDVGDSRGASPLWAFAGPSVEYARDFVRNEPDGPHVYEVEPVDLASVVENSSPGVQTEYGTQAGWRVMREVPPPAKGWWRRNPIIGGFDQRIGKSYQLAGRYVMDHPECKLVHGSIMGMGSPRNPHAWVIKPDGKRYDPVLDQEFPPDIHSGFFKTEIDHTYTNAEMCVEMLKSKHWGPWE